MRWEDMFSEKAGEGSIVDAMRGWSRQAQASGADEPHQERGEESASATGPVEREPLAPAFEQREATAWAPAARHDRRWDDPKEPADTGWPQAQGDEPESDDVDILALFGDELDQPVSEARTAPRRKGFLGRLFGRGASKESSEPAEVMPTYLAGRAGEWLHPEVPVDDEVTEPADALAASPAVDETDPPSSEDAGVAGPTGEWPPPDVSDDEDAPAPSSAEDEVHALSSEDTASAAATLEADLPAVAYFGRGGEDEDRLDESPADTAAAALEADLPAVASFGRGGEDEHPLDEAPAETTTGSAGTTVEPTQAGAEGDMPLDHGNEEDLPSAWLLPSDGVAEEPDSPAPGGAPADASSGTAAALQPDLEAAPATAASELEPEWPAVDSSANDEDPWARFLAARQGEAAEPGAETTGLEHTTDELPSDERTAADAAPSAIEATGYSDEPGSTEAPTAGEIRSQEVAEWLDSALEDVQAPPPPPLSGLRTRRLELGEDPTDIGTEPAAPADLRNVRQPADGAAGRTGGDWELPEDDEEADPLLSAFEQHARSAVAGGADAPADGEWDQPGGLDELLGADGDRLLEEMGEPDELRPFARTQRWAPQRPGDPDMDGWPNSDLAGLPGLDPAILDGAEAPLTAIGFGESEGAAAQGNSRWRTVSRELIETGLLALLVFLSVRASFQNFKVDGSSMFPTLEDGQFLIVNKLVYAEVDLQKLGDFVPFINGGSEPRRNVFHAPERGDIIVFRDPRDPKTDLIKRIVGLPGEMIEIVEGRVYINGQRLEEPYITSPWHGSKPKTLIGDHEYFVMGDNRENSFDSRGLGLISKDLIIGKAMLSYWPRDRFGFAPNEGGTLEQQPAVSGMRIDEP
jgi:signal peptidase I